jgi:phosphatidylinositol glycan class W
MLLMTILAILAVDFPVFPRSLVKCETYGVSLVPQFLYVVNIFLTIPFKMDLGVGSFVFSQGIVSAIPLLKNPTYVNAPLKPKLFSVTRKALPIILLGLVRVLLVKGTEYPVRKDIIYSKPPKLTSVQEHVSEYGVHWNFFITLALLPIMQVLLHPLIARIPLSLLGITVAIGLSYHPIFKDVI